MFYLLSETSTADAAATGLTPVWFKWLYVNVGVEPNGK
jgi:hypothetical protein